MAFLAVVREGIELALLLVATAFAGEAAGMLVGPVLGIALAVGFGVMLYQGVLHLNLKAFFQVTNVLLLFFAAGMVALGIHELVEGGLVPALMDPIYNINAIFSDKSTLGLLFKSLLGYNGNPAAHRDARLCQLPVDYRLVHPWSQPSSPTRGPRS